MLVALGVLAAAIGANDDIAAPQASLGSPTTPSIEDLQRYEQHTRSDGEHIKWLRNELDQRDAEMQARLSSQRRAVLRAQP